MSTLVSIGKILNFHGIKGEVKLGYTKGKEEQLQEIKNVFVKKDNDYTELTISSIRFHKGYALIKFKEINSINEVMEFKGCVLYIGKDVITTQLKEDEYLTSDLKGLEVFDTDGNRLGVVVSVSDNGATDLLSVKIKDNSQHFVPFVKELVPVVDIQNKKIIVKNIDGLIPKL